MKKTMLCMMMGATVLATSCLSEEHDFTPATGQESAQKGKIVLNLSSDTQFSAQTRALNEADFNNTANYTVQLLQGTEVLGQWTGPQESLVIEREIGTNNTYTVKAFYGEEQASSRSTFRVEGSNTFTLAAEDEKPVTVNCSPTCGKLVVAFDEQMATYYKDYSVTYSGTEALGSNTIAWAKDDVEPWYVLLKPSGEEITYTINLTTKDDYAHMESDGTKKTSATATGKFTLLRNKAYKLTVKPNYITSDNGEFTLSISIDEGTNDKEIDIQVPVEWI